MVKLIAIDEHVRSRLLPCILRCTLPQQNSPASTTFYAEGEWSTVVSIQPMSFGFNIVAGSNSIPFVAGLVSC